MVYQTNYEEVHLDIQIVLQNLFCNSFAAKVWGSRDTWKLGVLPDSLCARGRVGQRIDIPCVMDRPQFAILMGAAALTCEVISLRFSVTRLAERKKTQISDGSGTQRNKGYSSHRDIFTSCTPSPCNTHMKVIEVNILFSACPQKVGELRIWTRCVQSTSVASWL